MVSGFCSIAVGVFLVKFLSLEFAGTVGDWEVEPLNGLDLKGPFFPHFITPKFTWHNVDF